MEVKLFGFDLSKEHPDTFSFFFFCRSSCEAWNAWCASVPTPTTCSTTWRPSPCADWTSPRRPSPRPQSPATGGTSRRPWTCAAAPGWSGRSRRSADSCICWRLERIFRTRAPRSSTNGVSSASFSIVCCSSSFSSYTSCARSSCWLEEQEGVEKFPLFLSSTRLLYVNPSYPLDSPKKNKFVAQHTVINFVELYGRACEGQLCWNK